MACRLLAASLPVTDCDAINRDLQKPGAPGYLALEKAGLLYTDENGEIDRQAMADALFEDPHRRQKIEALLHPLIIGALKNWIAAQDCLCVAEVPLLFECHLENLFDETWTVTCSKETALARLKAFRQIDDAEAERRLALQMPPEEKIARSTRVIENNGTIEELAAALQKAIRQAETADTKPAKENGHA